MTDKKRAAADDLDDLHSTLAKQLKHGIENPEPVMDKSGNCVGYKLNPAFLSITRQFLKDNNVTGVAVAGSALDQLNMAMLPFDEAELQHLNPNFTVN